nr:hypothetical protein [Tanacetum cinerariifolium]
NPTIPSLVSNLLTVSTNYSIQPFMVQPALVAVGEGPNIPISFIIPSRVTDSAAMEDKFKVCLNNALVSKVVGSQFCTDVASPNVRTFWNYNYTLKCTSDANSVWLFSGLSLDRLFGPAGRPNIRSHDVILRVWEMPYLGGAFTPTQPWWSFWLDVYFVLGPRSLCACCLYYLGNDNALLFYDAYLPSSISWLGSHTDNVNAAVAEIG